MLCDNVVMFVFLFVQLGHMRTNKNCPRYGEDLDSQAEAIDPDKAMGKSHLVDPASLPQQKSVTKKMMPKSATKISPAENTEGQKSGSKTKVHSLKLKCGSIDKPPDDITLGSTQGSEQVAMSIIDGGNKSAVKVNKIVISSKTKPADVQLESHKPSIVIRRATDADRVHPEAQKTSIVFRPPVDTEKHKLSLIGHLLSYGHRQILKRNNLTKVNYQEAKRSYRPGPGQSGRKY